MPVDAQVEEIVPEDSGRPLQVGIPGGVRDRVAEVVGRHVEPDLFAEFPSGRDREHFPILDAAARREPPVRPRHRPGTEPETHE